jgi:hypothetical protein
MVSMLSLFGVSVSAVMFECFFSNPPIDASIAVFSSLVTWACLGRRMEQVISREDDSNNSSCCLNHSKRMA